MNPDRVQLLNAMQEFDRRLRITADWASWELNQAFKYAIELEGRRYPVKKIVSLATGAPVDQFSGGEGAGRANEMVERVGLRVVELSRSGAGSVAARAHLCEAQTIRGIAVEGSRFFMKSEWAPISARWPALSFSKSSVAEFLRNEYDPNRDFILYAGTTDPRRTEAEEHRSNLLSVLIALPGDPVRTRELVPWTSWQAVLTAQHMAWPWSLPVQCAWTLTCFPSARGTTPIAYASLGKLRNWGKLVEVIGDERSALLDLPIRWVDLPQPARLREAAARRTFLDTLRQEPNLNQEVTRMAGLIQGRVGPGGLGRRTVPERTIPADVGARLPELLCSKIEEQGHLCALCHRPLRFGSANKMLKCSPDRIDSSDPSYGPENLQITHLACNLAKNDGSTEEFEEWVLLVGGDEEPLSAQTGAHARRFGA